MSSTSGALLDNVTITINGGTIEGYVDVGDDRMESSETVTITGGTFLTENAIACYAANDAEIGKIQILGGQFATQVPEKYCATGYLPTDADPVTGKYTVMEGAYVAQIGTTKYTSLEDAFTAANAAGTATIQMLEDVDVTNVAYVVSSGKTITLDLNGNYLEGEGWGVVPTQVSQFSDFVANGKALIPVGTAFWYYSNKGGAKVEWK